MPRWLAIPTLAAILLLAQAAGAGASVPFAPCMNSPGFSCTSLDVPLDRSGAVPGTVTLSIERMQAGAAQSEDAVVALAGGPGQAAVPLAGALAHVLAPALGGRDLIVFDQRGTGASGPLSCAALEGPVSDAGAPRAFESCAQQIGPSRGSYTTAESAADIEAIRQALGYRQLVLYGVSYGTKLALQYAERYPASVQALVLDSVVPTGHDDPFSLASFQAIAPVLSELCSGGACAAITANPAADLARLAAEHTHRPLRGRVWDGRGRRHAASVSDADLFNLLVAGDLNPALRALLPAAVASALRGDPSPLLRLNLLSEGLIPNVPLPPSRAPAAARAGIATTPGGAPGASIASRAGGAGGTPMSASDGVNEALFVTTTCEEAAFPWQRSAPPATRRAEALAQLHALPTAALYPFDAAVEWQDSLLGDCARWPNVAGPPPPAGPLPAVPTLLLSGAQDLRTPTSNAQLIANRIAGAQLVVVPYTGHSVLGSDFSGCAAAALKAFFAAATPQACAAGANPFTPSPVTPRRLSGVRPLGGVRGRPGRTLTAVLDTIVDLERQVIGATLQAEQRLPSGSSFGGLRGGYARLSPTALRLHSLSFVEGVAISGTFPISHGRLVRSTIRVSGRDAAAGDLRIGGAPMVTGRLGGTRIDVNLARVHLARSGHHQAQAATLSLEVGLPEPALARLR